MRFAWVLLVVLAGCRFDLPAATCDSNEQCNAAGGGRCEPNGFCSYADASCPSGQIYGDNAGDLSGVCVGQEPGPDGGVRVCYGVGLVKPCFPAALTGEITLQPPMPMMPINTDTSTLCATNVTEADGFCVIAAERILIEDQVAAEGSRPLVLVASSTIEISATLDVASHRSEGQNPPYSTTQIGAGSGHADCGAGTAPVNGGGGGGGGGGAGGSFGGTGGTGGNAPDNGAGGRPADAVQAVTTLRGGCPGQDGVRGTTFGLGGHGGGAVYLIANTDIRISSTINASGEGGLPGITGSAGAGGGGSGGMIGLDAPTIMNTGAVFANGGSGGEGSGETTRGDPGIEATGAAPAPGAGGSSAIGGDGGAGGAGGSAGGALEGSTGLAGASGGGGTDGGGGGGGGGTGIIVVYRGELTGNHSPLPTR